MNNVVYQDECLEISLLNDLRELARVASDIDVFCRERKIGSQTAYSVNLAIDEVLTHIISDGYEDNDPHRIEIIVRKEGQTLVLSIVDDSQSADISQAPDGVDNEKSGLESVLGNLGLFLVHQMMDSVDYRNMHGCNVVTMTKAIPSAEVESEENESQVADTRDTM